MKKMERQTEELTRRTALTVLLGAGAFAFGCSSSSDATDSGAGASGAAGTGTAGTGASSTGEGGASSADCEVTPEGEIGPYFSDDSDARFLRSNIIANLDGTSVQTGIPLTLNVTVIDTENACAPYVNAQVDIWHCNAAGVYSDQASESTTTETWLRGYQITDADGKVGFSTVIPGWYSGRTTHIHLRVRSTYSTASSNSDGTNTTQLFFDQTLVDTLATSVTPYSAEGKNSTTNATDHVYDGETNGANLLSLSGDNTSGYTAEITIGLPITSSGSTTGTTDGVNGGGPGAMIMGDGGPGAPPSN
jgi:protocatechuate 3,4-dioxygenase beta subunit